WQEFTFFDCYHTMLHKLFSLLMLRFDCQPISVGHSVGFSLNIEQNVTLLHCISVTVCQWNQWCSESTFQCCSDLFNTLSSNLCFVLNPEQSEFSDCDFNLFFIHRIGLARASLYQEVR